MNFVETFLVFHVNAFNTILYFLKSNFFFVFVLVAIGFMVMEELKIDNCNYVSDDRRMI